jgi:hypothetical protein
MSLTACRECKKEISNQARSCPQCGAPYPARPEWKGWGFDWKSQTTLFGYPLINVAVGRDEKGNLRVAKGIIAIGQFGIGLITIAQFGVGLLFGIGQFVFGLTAVAQFAVGLIFALGQVAIGYIAIGQMAFGYYAFCQLGVAKYLWCRGRKDIEAVEFFRQLLQRAKTFLS